MNVIAISTNLLLAYGTVVLAAGAVVGAIIGRAMRPRRPLPSPNSPEMLRLRVERLELEAELTQALLERLLDHASSARELSPTGSRVRAA